jgi:hypothetical protein
MSIQVYIDNTNFILIKATCFSELETNFKSYTDSNDVSFYTFANKKIGHKVMSDKDLKEGYLYATDIEYNTNETSQVEYKDTRNKKLKFKNGKCLGKSRNMLVQMKIHKTLLEKTLRALPGEKNLKEQVRENKYRKNNENLLLNEDEKKIISIKNELHKYSKDKRLRIEKKFLMKANRDKIILM